MSSEVSPMIQIRPVSDLRNKFPEIESMVNENQPVYLTKNGYGAMVVLSLRKYAEENLKSEKIFYDIQKFVEQLRLLLSEQQSR